ncbi:MAG: MarR family transcriptional regulator [Aquincola sp.]|nr:MarR family transcriptional regulator [Aquincola sp.]
MSTQLTALLLARLDARPGEQVTVADLAGHIGIAPAAVQATLEGMVHTGLVLAQREAVGGHIVAATVPQRKEAAACR